MPAFARLLLVVALAVMAVPASQAASDRELVAARSEQMRARVAAGHPRVLLQEAELPSLRSFWAVAQGRSDMPAAFRNLLPAFDQTLTPQPRAVSNKTSEVAWREGYMAASNAGNTAQRFALGHLLTGDPRYGREAARWLMHLASWDIDVSVYNANDELFIQHLRPMIVAYDWAWPALTEAERETVGKVLRKRLQILADKVQPKFSLTKPVDASNDLSHPMRFISTLGLGGQALFHEAPEAPAWLAWCHEYYSLQFPVWGGDAGGWSEGLNYWTTGLSQHLRFLEALALAGFDAPLKRPFFRNNPYFGVYNLLPYEASSFGDLNNITRPSQNAALILEKYALLNRDPYVMQYARLLATDYPSDYGYYTFNGIDTVLHVFRREQAKLPPANLAELPGSRHFDDIGWVAMHSALGDAKGDIMFGFKSSPQGSASHSFADQNSFVLNAFGQPLAIASGWREWYDSPHHVGWSRTTQSKNAILIDGAGQTIKSAFARGQITRFVQGTNFTFATGDATPAYGDRASRALRHVFFVDRRFFVMLDEIVGPEMWEAQWLIHAREKMQFDAASARLDIARGDAALRVQFVQPAASALKFVQTDRFAVPVNERYADRMKNDWHATLTSKAQNGRALFLSALLPQRRGAEFPAVEAVAGEGHALRVGDALILLAPSDTLRAQAGAFQLQGVAASSSPRALRWIAATSVRQGEVSVSASVPLSGELQWHADATGLDVSAPASAVLRLGGLKVSRVQGVAATAWRMDAAGVLELQLAAGQHQLRLLP